MAVDDDGNDSAAATVTVSPFGAYGKLEAVELDVAGGCLRGTAGTMEYSTDGTASWSPCDSATSITMVGFAAGDEVWVRQAESPAETWYLGTVSALSGVDLCATGPIYVDESGWPDRATGIPGEALRAIVSWRNAGTDSAGSMPMQITGYLSTDRRITSSDTQVFQSTASRFVGSGEMQTSLFTFSVPSVASGVYYIGAIVDSDEGIAEMVEDNNATPAAFVAEFRIGDDGPLADGAFKVVNSWGDWGGWDKVADGHYWITYATLKHLKSAIYYYYNSFDHVYEPTVLAVFEIDHPYRDEAWIKVGLGDPADPVVLKEMQARWSMSLHSGPLPFPDNALAVDVSEFASYLNDHDLYLEIENLGSSPGSVDAFSVEFYNDYDSAPFKTITGSTGSIPTSGSVSFTAATSDSLSGSELAQIQPPSRSDEYGTTFLERLPTRGELEADQARIGVFDERADYNVIVDGFGTGLAPPSESQWSRMRKLEGVDGSRALGVLPDSVDNSATPYFPPVGSQANEGSCVAFSMGYYINTYNEARERGWDLSSVSWTGGYYGEPASAQERIASPDFLYHQINSGVDGGSTYFSAVSILTLVGNSSWQAMPYDSDDHTGWPSETAFREAARFRGAPVGNHQWEDEHQGYFVIEEDAHIDLLKQLIAEGYCVSISVNAGGLYALLDEHDVIDDTSTEIVGTNHANTVVGYKEGSAWEPTDPER